MLPNFGYPLRRQIVVSQSRALTAQDVNALIQADSEAQALTLSVLDGNAIGTGGYFYITAPFGSANAVTVIFPPGNSYNLGKTDPIVLSDDYSVLIIAGPGRTWNVFFSDKSFVEIDADGNPVPPNNRGTNFGSRLRKWKTVHASLDVRVGSTYDQYFNPQVLTYNPDALGSIEAICVGYNLGGVTEVYARPAMTWHSIKGRVANWDPAGSTARLNQYTIGFMRGSVYCYNAGTSRAEIEQGPGSHNSFIGGYVSAFSDHDAIMRHDNGGVVAFTWCRVYAYASGFGSPIVEVTGENAITFVNTGNEARVYSRHLAAFMQGLAYGVLPNYALMENVAGAACAFIQGRCQTTPGFDAKMRVEDDAGVSWGRASGATIETRAGQAALARGFAQSGAQIYASGHGSTAWGWAAAGQTIGVAANNSDQWGVGVNDLPNSTSFGTGWRFKKTPGPPTSPTYRDAWAENGHLYVFSGGVARNLSNIPP